MAIVQALLALITKSAGKILNVLFGWAVHALFGETSSRDQTVLSVLVAAAVAWPLLLAGLVAPRVAALVLAFVPLPRWIPTYAIRIVWAVLAITVPTLVGLAVAARSPPGSPREPLVKRVLRGFPITIGLAGAFILMFVSVPVMRLAALLRGRKSVNIPLMTEGDGYHRVAAALRDVLARHALVVERARPGWWVIAPMRLLLWFGGASFRSYVPRELEHFASPRLVMSLYPSGVLLRGEARSVAAAHALIAEAIVETDGLETVDVAAQKLEREIRRLWKEQVIVGTGRAQAANAGLLAVARELARLEIEFDDWRALYRQILQVDRALRGNRQLMESGIQRRSAEFVDDGPTLPSLTLPDSELAYDV